MHGTSCILSRGIHPPKWTKNGPGIPLGKLSQQAAPNMQKPGPCFYMPVHLRPHIPIPDAARDLRRSCSNVGGIFEPPSRRPSGCCQTWREIPATHDKEASCPQLGVLLHISSRATGGSTRNPNNFRPEVVKNSSVLIMSSRNSFPLNALLRLVFPEDVPWGL